MIPRKFTEYPNTSSTCQARGYEVASSERRGTLTCINNEQGYGCSDYGSSTIPYNIQAIYL